MTQNEAIKERAERVAGKPVQSYAVNTITEALRERTIWEGAVHTFRSDDGFVYAWATNSPAGPHYFALVGTSPIDSPVAAVRAWLAATVVGE